jgi:hypothetical protein
MVKILSIFIAPILFFSCSDLEQTSTTVPTTNAPPAAATAPTAMKSDKSNKPDNNFIDFNVRGVRLGDTDAETFRRLGKPIKRHLEKVDYCGINEFLVLDYPGIKIQLDADSQKTYRILEIHVSSPSVDVSPDIKIGITSERVKEKLGKPYMEKQEVSKLYLYYLTKDDDNAELIFRDGKLVKVRLYVNPC